MRTEDLLTFVRRRPFQPFRLTLTDGQTYEVRHPEMAMVGHSMVIIGFPRPDDPEPVFDRSTWVSLPHIMKVQLLETPATPVTN